MVMDKAIIIIGEKGIHMNLAAMFHLLFVAGNDIIMETWSNTGEVVELRDLFPTFLDIANGTKLIPNDINGSSILIYYRSSLVVVRRTLLMVLMLLLLLLHLGVNG